MRRESNDEGRVYRLPHARKYNSYGLTTLIEMLKLELLPQSKIGVYGDIFRAVERLIFPSKRVRSRFPEVEAHSMSVAVFLSELSLKLCQQEDFKRQMAALDTNDEDDMLLDISEILGQYYNDIIYRVRLDTLAAIIIKLGVSRFCNPD